MNDKKSHAELGSDLQCCLLTRFSLRHGEGVFVCMCNMEELMQSSEIHRRAPYPHTYKGLRISCSSVLSCDYLSDLTDNLYQRHSISECRGTAMDEARWHSDR